MEHMNFLLMFVVGVFLGFVMSALSGKKRGQEDKSEELKKQKELMQSEINILRKKVREKSFENKSLAEEIEKLERLSGIDPLTGIYNRAHLMKVVPKEIERAERYEHDLCYLFIDIDNFKRINDEMPDRHQAGDKFLLSIARMIKRVTRKTDIYARLGGDEFFIVMPETSQKAAQKIAERIDFRIRKTATGQKIPEEFNVGASIGVICHQPGKTFEEMIKESDIEMYAVKDRRKS